MRKISREGKLVKGQISAQKEFQKHKIKKYEYRKDQNMLWALFKMEHFRKL